MTISVNSFTQIHTLSFRLTMLWLQLRDLVVMKIFLGKSKECLTLVSTSHSSVNVWLVASFTSTALQKICLHSSHCHYLLAGQATMIILVIWVIVVLKLSCSVILSVHATLNGVHTWTWQVIRIKSLVLQMQIRQCGSTVFKVITMVITSMGKVSQCTHSVWRNMLV